jgi:hypothetical protein
MIYLSLERLIDFRNWEELYTKHLCQNTTRAEERLVEQLNSVFTKIAKNSFLYS